MDDHYHPSIDEQDEYYESGIELRSRAMTEADRSPDRPMMAFEWLIPGAEELSRSRARRGGLIWYGDDE